MFSIESKLLKSYTKQKLIVIWFVAVQYPLYPVFPSINENKTKDNIKWYLRNADIFYLFATETLCHCMIFVYSSPEVRKLFFMLNSAKHEILNAH